MSLLLRSLNPWTVTSMVCHRAEMEKPLFRTRYIAPAGEAFQALYFRRPGHAALTRGLLSLPFWSLVLRRRRHLTTTATESGPEWAECDVRRDPKCVFSS